MKEWFTIEKIDEKTFIISEYGHWEQMHSYLIVGDERAILLDTGLGVANIKKVVERLTDLPIQVITTHVHWDHIGGHCHFDRIGVHELEKSWLEDKFPLPLNAVKENLMKSPCNLPEAFNIDDYTIPKVKTTMALKDGDYIELGNRMLEVIHTPGHSPGHICLYEKETGYLFSGDLVYKGKLDAFYPTTNPVQFMNSINKVAKLAVKRVFPAHYSLKIDQGIIKEIQQAFKEINDSGKLVQGQGILEYENFSIHL